MSSRKPICCKSSNEPKTIKAVAGYVPATAFFYLSATYKPATLSAQEQELFSAGLRKIIGQT